MPYWRVKGIRNADWLSMTFLDHSHLPKTPLWEAGFEIQSMLDWEL